MRSVRCVLNISLQNIRKWSEDYRIWTIAVLVIILCFDSVRIMNTIAAALGNSSSLWIYPFAYSQYHMKLLYSLPIILMFCNAPFIDSNKLMILTRIGGRRYLAGQIGYIILASLAYYGFVFLCTIVIFLPVVEFSADWGDAIYTLAFSDRIKGRAVLSEGFGTCRAELHSDCGLPYHPAAFVAERSHVRVYSVLVQSLVGKEILRQRDMRDHYGVLLFRGKRGQRYGVPAEIFSAFMDDAGYFGDRS